MRRTGKGSIINVSSRSGIVGIPNAAAYAASKAAVRFLPPGVADGKFGSQRVAVRIHCVELVFVGRLIGFGDPRC